MERQTTVISQEELNRQSAICHEIASYWNTQGRTPLAFVDTYGCQQNEADSERIRGMLRECGLSKKGKPKDTRTRDQKAAMRSLIEQLKEEYPLATMFCLTPFTSLPKITA